MKKIFKTFVGFVVAALAVEVAVLITSIAVKWDSFTMGRPIAVIAHAHLMGIGAIVFLILMLFEKQFSLTNHKLFKWFYLTYLVGIGLTVFVMLYKGFTQFAGGTLINAIPSSIAPLGHTLTFVGLFLLIKIIYDKAIKEHLPKKSGDSIESETVIEDEENKPE